MYTKDNFKKDLELIKPFGFSIPFPEESIFIKKELKISYLLLI